MSPVRSVTYVSVRSLGTRASFSTGALAKGAHSINPFYDGGNIGYQPHVTPEALIAIEPSVDVDIQQAHHGALANAVAKTTTNY